MSEAESLMNYQKAIDLAAQAQSDDSHDWQEMQKIVARCKAALAAQGVGAQIETSIKEWNRIRVWRQDNGTADEEFVKRIDEYLVRWKTIESEGTRQAKVARVRVTGSSGGDAAATGDAAWQAVMEDVKLMEADGRFGDAIAKIDAYWEANKSAAPTMVAPVEAEKKRLEAAAGKWFDKQLAVAIHYWVDNNDKFKSKKILENAGQKIGLPGYAERAAEEYQKLVSGKK
jgi:hypothetical protein